MGSESSSPRSVSLEQDANTGVVKVSESVARRLVGKPEPVTTVNDSSKTSPSISSDVLNAEVDKLKSHYNKRIHALEKQNKELHQTTTEQFAQAVEEVERKFLKTTAAPICDDLQTEVMRCYQDNGKETINCSQLVKSYSNCVQHQRESILTKKDCQPCLLAQMARGPCGPHFMKAYDCYLDGENTDKEDCGMLYLQMKECWDAHPDYGYQKIIDRAYDDGGSKPSKNQSNGSAKQSMTSVAQSQTSNAQSQASSSQSQNKMSETPSKKAEPRKQS